MGAGSVLESRKESCPRGAACDYGAGFAVIVKPKPTAQTLPQVRQANSVCPLHSFGKVMPESAGGNLRGGGLPVREKTEGGKNNARLACSPAPLSRTWRS